MSDLDTFYMQLPEPQKSCMEALRRIVLKHHSNISETIKYSMPCFCFQKKPLCYLWIDKTTAEPYLLFVDGIKMDHPLLEQQARKKMKIFRLNPHLDLPIDELQSLLDMALSLKVLT